MPLDAEEKDRINEIVRDLRKRIDDLLKRLERAEADIRRLRGL